MPCTKSPEVLCRLGHIVSVQPKHHTSSRLLSNVDVKVHPVCKDRWGRWIYMHTNQSAYWVRRQVRQMNLQAFQSVCVLSEKAGEACGMNIAGNPMSVRTEWEGRWGMWDERCRHSNQCAYWVRRQMKQVGWTLQALRSLCVYPQAKMCESAWQPPCLECERRQLAPACVSGLRSA